ncbi:MAG: hypothetical protein A07HR60_00175 [uncultured archaeon A07HR60]|nr:MAG: hypothetical protein A07HR60_00175 [uncultured archaeon A07HR60]
MSGEENSVEFLGEDSQYDLVRAKGGITTQWSIREKLYLCAGVLFAAALLWPAVLLLPGEVQGAYFGPNPGSDPIALASMTVLSVSMLSVAAAGLTAVAVRRSRIDRISESQAWSLVGFEEIFSGFAFITGGSGVAASLVLISIGFRGIETVQSLETYGIVPYDSVLEVGISVWTASVVAVIAGALVFGLGLFVNTLDRD